MIEESKYQEAKEELIGILNSLGKPMINNKSAIKKLLTISVPLREAKENEEEIKKIMLEIFDDVYDEFMKEKENSRDENKEPTIAEKAEAFNLLIRDNISRIKKKIQMKLYHKKNQVILKKN